MKKLIYVLVLALFIFNCSKDDDKSTTTFLEIYEGTVWINNADGELIYIRFINNINTPLEFWVELIDCYWYDFDDFSSNNSTITENTSNLLEFVYEENDGGVEYRDIIRITVSGNSLKVEANYYEDGSLIETDIQYLQSSNEDVDNFVLCDD